MVINPDPPNIRRKGALSLPPLARVNRPPAGHPPARTAAFPRVRRLPAPAERGSVTRSNIHQPERIRTNIIASMSLATLLRLTEPCSDRRAVPICVHPRLSAVPVPGGLPARVFGVYPSYPPRLG